MAMPLSFRPALALCLALAAACLATQPALAAPKAKEWAAAQAAYAGELDLLGQIVNIDSGTGNVEGGEKIAALLSPYLTALGATVERVPAEAPGLPANLVARLTGTGKGKVLLIGHLDTVFEPGEAAKRPFTVAGDVATGAGVMDEKGGVVTGVTALKLIHDLHFTDFASLTLLIETSEEQGSPGARHLIDKLARDSDVEFNLEPEARDTVTVWRKSSANLVLEVAGRAAHAGMEPEAGRNAADEAINQVRRIEAAFPRSGDGITVNLTLMKAGSRSNIIPAQAQVTLNVRGRTAEDMRAVETAARKIAASPEIADTTVKMTYDWSFPPLVENARVDGLAARATHFAEEIGRPLALGGNGGASESALADAVGTPALDGLGATGSGAHTPHESLDLTSVTPRLYILVRLIESTGANPPPRG